MKMILTDVARIPIGISLAVVGGILLLSILASILWPAKPASTVETSEQNPG